VAQVLAKECSRRIHFWPFDGWQIPSRTSVVAEVYPSLWVRRFTVVITGKSLPVWALQRLGVQVHNSMARGDQSMAEGDDGDTLFTVTTGKAVGATISDEDMDHLGILASETAWTLFSRACLSYRRRRRARTLFSLRRNWIALSPAMPFPGPPSRLCDARELRSKSN
jgi:hypothetical protein